MSRHAAEDVEKRTGVISTGAVVEAIDLNVVARGKVECKTEREN